MTVASAHATAFVSDPDMPNTEVLADIPALELRNGRRIEPVHNTRNHHIRPRTTRNRHAEADLVVTDRKETMCFNARGSAAPGLDSGDERRRSVIKTDPTEPESGDQPTANQGAARRTRGIRFSNSEWQEVKEAAELYDVPAAEFVRKRILDIARGRVDATPAPLAPLIERTFRYTYVLATHKHDELIREGRAEEMGKLAKEAQALQGQLLGGASG